MIINTSERPSESRSSQALQPASGHISDEFCDCIPPGIIYNLFISLGVVKDSKGIPSIEF